MTNAATSKATLSEQTQRDLESILETLDQRIHEITDETSGGTGASAELTALEALRGSAAGVLAVG